MEFVMVGREAVQVDLVVEMETEMEHCVGVG